MISLRSKVITAIDIGCYSTKIISLRKNRRGQELAVLGSVMMPDEAFLRGEIKDVEIIAQSLDDFFKKRKFMPKTAVTTVSSKNLIIRTIKMPLMTESELEEAVRWEAADYLPFPVDDALMDYSLINRGDKELEIMVVATRKKIVESFLAPLKLIGIKPVAVFVQPLALLTLVGKLHQVEEPVMIIDCGATNSRIVIGNRNKVFLFRNVSIGGGFFTRTLAERLGVDLREAEEIKKKSDISKDVAGFNSLFGVPSGMFNNPGAGVAVSGEEGIKQKFSKEDILLSIANGLVEEASRSLEFFSAQNRGRSVSACYITGGGSRLKGLSELLSAEVGQEFKIIKPFDGMKCNKTVSSIFAERKEDTFTEFSVAMGLALGELK